MAEVEGSTQFGEVEGNTTVHGVFEKTEGNLNATPKKIEDIVKKEEPDKWEKEEVRENKTIEGVPEKIRKDFITSLHESKVDGDVVRAEVSLYKDGKDPENLRFKAKKSPESNGVWEIELGLPNNIKKRTLIAQEKPPRQGKKDIKHSPSRTASPVRRP